MKDNLVDILKSYSLTEEEINEITNIIEYIFKHLEFQKRLTSDYPHHGDTSLGQHILDDTVLTYQLSKKYLNKSNDNNYRLDLALKISMFHDLYTYPWQNNNFAKDNKFFNKHGFRHPVESVINSCTWFKEDFINESDAKILIDGIIHHMIPLPVIIIDNIVVNNRELNNFDSFKKLPENLQNLIIESTNQNKFLNLSWKKSKYKEGRIMAKADKKASLKEFNNLFDVMALITGKNKNLRK